VPPNKRERPENREKLGAVISSTHTNPKKQLCKKGDAKLEKQLSQHYPRKYQQQSHSIEPKSKRVRPENGESRQGSRDAVYSNTKSDKKRFYKRVTPNLRRN
jgi:hypothetical protein